MRRREIILAIGALSVAGSDAIAQQGTRLYRIGVLSPEVPPPGLLENFEQELRTLGYTRGQNISLEIRIGEADDQRLSALAEELVRMRVDVIVAINFPAVQAARRATATLPIVMTRIGDPIKLGLVPSLSKPGGNITGLSFIPSEVSGKRLQLLKETIPGVSRVAVLWYENPGTTLIVQEMQAPSQGLGINLSLIPVNGAADFVAALATAKKDGVEALVVVDDALITRYRQEILDLAAKHALPVFALFRPMADAGAVMTYGPSAPAIYRRTAHYVDRILKGVNPADLPVEQPTKFELIINLKAASALGLTMPPTLLARADEVIE